MTTPVISASSTGERAILANASGSSRSHSLDLKIRRRFSAGRDFVTRSKLTRARIASIHSPAESATERPIFSIRTPDTRRGELFNPVSDPAPPDVGERWQGPIAVVGVVGVVHEGRPSYHV